MNILIFADIDYFNTLLSDVRLSLLKKISEYWTKLNFEKNDNKIYFHLISQDPSKYYYNKPLSIFIENYFPNKKVDLVVFYICVKFFHNYKMVSDCDKLDVPKVLHIEDMHHLKEINDFVLYHNIKYIIENNEKTSQFQKLKLSLPKDVKYYNNESTIDTDIFKDYEFEKKYDILLYGCDHIKQYPFRNRLFNIIKKSNRFQVKHIPFKSWKKDKNSVFGKLLAHNINRAWISIATTSKYGYFIKKYIEIPACNTMVAGNDPLCYNSIYQDMVILKPEMTDETILDLLELALKDKIILKERIKRMYNAVRKNFSLINGCENITNIYTNIINDNPL